MATFQCTMLGHILYDERLTFQELLDTEARVIGLMGEALGECGAEHIDFFPNGDELLMECVFPTIDRNSSRALCDAVIRYLGSDVLARFVFMDRRLDSVVFYFLGRGKWKEQAMSVPDPQKALSGWIVRQERKREGGATTRTARVRPKRLVAEAFIPDDDGSVSSLENLSHVKVRLDASGLDMSSENGKAEFGTDTQ